MLKLKSLNPAQARFVAKIAQAARLQRDDLLGHVAINGLVEPRSAAREPSTVLLAPELQRAGQTAPLATLRAVITALP
ncbi:hypothetical protein, partial [Stenotrophomonas maltophilia]|uniref:hypothetical protein n=1 Tax=Stenotrophomonas maltophilia TaxID=40324 RepID=UPI0013D92B6E